MDVCVNHVPAPSRAGTSTAAPVQGVAPCNPNPNPQLQNPARVSQIGRLALRLIESHSGFHHTVPGPPYYVAPSAADPRQEFRRQLHRQLLQAQDRQPQPCLYLGRQPHLYLNAAAAADATGAGNASTALHRAAAAAGQPPAGPLPVLPALPASCTIGEAGRAIHQASGAGKDPRGRSTASVWGNPALLPGPSRHDATAALPDYPALRPGPFRHDAIVPDYPAPRLPAAADGPSRQAVAAVPDYPVPNRRWGMPGTSKDVQQVHEVQMPPNKAAIGPPTWAKLHQPPRPSTSSTLNPKPQEASHTSNPKTIELAQLKAKKPNPAFLTLRNMERMQLAPRTLESQAQQEPDADAQGQVLRTGLAGERQQPPADAAGSSLVSPEESSGQQRKSMVQSLGRLPAPLRRSSSCCRMLSLGPPMDGTPEEGQVSQGLAAAAGAAAPPPPTVPGSPANAVQARSSPAPQPAGPIP